MSEVSQVAERQFQTLTEEAYQYLSVKDQFRGSRWFHCRLDHLDMIAVWKGRSLELAEVQQLVWDDGPPAQCATEGWMFQPYGALQINPNPAEWQLETDGKAMLTQDDLVKICRRWSGNHPLLGWPVRLGNWLDGKDKNGQSIIVPFSGTLWFFDKKSQKVFSNRRGPLGAAREVLAEERGMKEIVPSLIKEDVEVILQIFEERRQEDRRRREEEARQRHDNLRKKGLAALRGDL